jgi:hypothetical protein
MGLFYLKAPYHKYQFRPGHTGIFSSKGRWGETALFQTFVVQYKTPGLPVQEFKMGAVAVQKNKYIATGGLPA